MRRVTVTSNCQTAGITAALMQILQYDEITPLPIQQPSAKVEQEAYAANLSGCEIWVTLGTRQWVQQCVQLSGNRKLRVLKIPPLAFTAFHPDIVYIRKPAQETIEPGYQSRIGIWCYKNGLAVDEALGLFTRQVFEDLGYFDAWYASKDALQVKFRNSDLAGDFDRFFSNVQRHGAFMHTINHPLPLALVHLAKIIAVHLGASKSVYDEAVEIPDGLCKIRWPVYPPIAEQLSLEGSYDFVLDGRTMDLKAYLQRSYKRLVDRGLRPKDVHFHSRFADTARLDQVLEYHAGIGKTKP